MGNREQLSRKLEINIVWCRKIFLENILNIRYWQK